MFDIVVEQMIYGGSGIARMDNGRIVLVPFTLPGEKVTIEAFNESNRNLTGKPIQINNPNVNRVDPPCPYYSLCGGCHYQHVDYSFQLEIKKQILKEQLERLGGLGNSYIQATVASPRNLNYRNHVQFHLDSTGKPGFQKALSHDVIPVEKCLLLEEPLNELLRSLSFESDTGLSRIALRDDGQGTPVLFMTGDSKNPPEFAVDFPLNVVYRGPVGDMVLSGENFNLFDINGKRFQVSAGSFFQTNRDIASCMIDLLMENLKFEKTDTVLDCYCGVGFFSAFIADKVQKIIGIESYEDACNDFAINLDEYDHIDLYQGYVEHVLPELDLHPDIVIIDPPRAGIAPAAIKALIKSNPKKIAYISCDPSTLARDLKILVSSNYVIQKIIPVDMFPQTYHIETMTFLTKNE